MSTVVDRTSVVHRCPPAIHRISTGFVPRPVENVGTLPARCPQNLQQEIHTLPQAVDRDVTESVCPHRFPQDLSTSVGSVSESCPPLGIKACERLWIAVENVGTNSCVLTLTAPPRRGSASAEGRAVVHRSYAQAGEKGMENGHTALFRVALPVGNPVRCG